MANFEVTILGAIQNPTGHGWEQLAAADSALSRAVRQGVPIGSCRTCSRLISRQ